jgi:hypothetical protein
MNTIEIIEKVKSAIKLLEEIDDLTGNEMCLEVETAEDGTALTILSYWGVSHMLAQHLDELYRKVENKACPREK